MIITEKQLLMLFQVLVDSLPIVGSASPFKHNQEIRGNLAEEILNQQSNRLIEIKDNE